MRQHDVAASLSPTRTFSIAKDLFRNQRVLARLKRFGRGAFSFINIYQLSVLRLASSIARCMRTVVRGSGGRF
jgi:hypothetical protein